MNKKLGAHLSLFSANLIYAASFTIAKQVMPAYIHPLGFVLLRAAGAAVLFWMASLFVKEKTELKDIPKFALLAMFGVAINQMLFLKGLSLTSPISAAIMMVTSPILVVIVASFLIKEKITWLKITGVLVGFLGAVLLMLSGKGMVNADADNPLGDLFVFINALSWGTYIVLVKPFMMKYKTVTVLKWTFLFGSIIVFPFGLDELLVVDFSSWPTNVWLFAAFIVVVVTFFGYLLNIYALNQLSPSIVSAYIYLQPVLASVIALSFGKDQLSFSKIISALLIFVGVYVVSMPNKRKESVKNK